MARLGQKRLEAMAEEYFKAHPNDPVGDDSHCPLEFVAKENGIPASVGSATYSIEGTQHKLSPVLDLFVYYVDTEPRQAWKSITGKKAMEYLERARREAE